MSINPRRARLRKEYWDSSAFIEYMKDRFDTESVTKTNDVWALMSEVKEPNSGRLIVISTMVIAEVWLWITRYDAGRKAIVEDIFFHDREFVQIIGLNPAIAESVGNLGQTYPDLTVPDLIHVATALSAGCTTLFTYDGASTSPTKRNRSDKLITYDGKIGTPPLRICVPKPDHPRLI